MEHFYSLQKINSCWSTQVVIQTPCGLFFKEFSAQKPDELKVIVVDNAAFHKAKKLKLPNNIILVFQPPYSPELNPAEQIWAWYKREFTNKVFYYIDKVVEFIINKSKELN